MNVRSRLYKALALTGAVPFAASAFMALAGIDVPVPAALVASSYGLTIISFLCGVHWGTYLYRDSEAPLNLFLTSNVIVVAAWLTWLLASLGVALGTQVLAFAILLLIDYRMFSLGLVTQDYFVTRFEATTVAVLSHAVVIFVVAF
jgi:hypothetical protein